MFNPFSISNTGYWEWNLGKSESIEQIWHETNFHPLEVVVRGSETQLPVGENLSTMCWEPIQQNQMTSTKPPDTNDRFCSKCCSIIALRHFLALMVI